MKTSVQRVSSKDIGSTTEGPLSFVPEVVYEDSQCIALNSTQSNSRKMENCVSSIFTNNYGCLGTWWYIQIHIFI